jgi:hypothetical protein
VTPEPGEVWQDSDGTCLAYTGALGWFAFGRHEPLDLGLLPDVDQPVRRLTTAAGEVAPERRDEPASGALTPADVLVRDDLIQALWLYTSPHTERQLTTAQRELLYDIACPDLDRWWRCAACDDARVDHRHALDGDRVIRSHECTVCSCVQFERKPPEGTIRAQLAEPGEDRPAGGQVQHGPGFVVLRLDRIDPASFPADSEPYAQVSPAAARGIGRALIAQADVAEALNRPPTRSAP